MFCPTVFKECTSSTIVNYEFLLRISSDFMSSSFRECYWIFYVDPCSLGPTFFRSAFLGVILNYEFILFRTGDIKDPQQPLCDAKSGWQCLALNQHIQSPSINHQHSFQYWISTITFGWLILSFFLEVLGSKLVRVSKICKTRNLKILYKFYTSIAYQRWKNRVTIITLW